MSKENSSALTFKKRIERVRWTWRGNRTLVHATLRRSLQLAIKSFFVLPKPSDNRERRRLEVVCVCGHDPMIPSGAHHEGCPNG